MTMAEYFRHQFVEEIPEKLSECTLYVTLSYDAMVHLCACGCGEEIVTPLGPTDWSYSYNGESVSVYPSIGNWSHSCRSHYFIRGSQIIWAGDWTDEQVQLGREHDKAAKAIQFKSDNVSTPPPRNVPASSSKPGWRARLKRLFGIDS